MIKLIIFDWDDVITLGAKEGYYACYRETIKELGINLSEEELHRRIQKKWGQPFREELREIIQDNSFLLDKACTIYDTKFWGDTFISELKEVKGVNQTLERLSKKYILAVATGNHPKMLEDKIIPKFRIPSIFSQIITVFDIPVEKTKPNPFMLKQIINKQKVKPQECVYVGDAKNDVLMAQNAKVEPIVVLTGHLSRREAISLGVKRIVPDITQLEHLLN